MSTVHLVRTGTDLRSDVARVFGPFGGARRFLRDADEVFIKVNAVDLKPHCFTPPDLIEALVCHLREEGARHVYVMDNCTQGNFTRLVFHATGMAAAVRRAGGRLLCLDEGPEETVRLSTVDRSPPPGHAYDQDTFRLPAILADRLLRKRESVCYINVPKFKTHCMTTVTLGIKSQWGFVAQRDRVADHNHLLHAKLVDILEMLRPDFTLVDAREATQHGHYPSDRLRDRQIVPYGLLLGGDDVVSTDALGCHLMGFDWRDVEQVRLAHERGLGIADLDGVEIIGDPNEHRRELSWELLPIFPKDVDVHRGEALCCKEGCGSNVMACLQTFSLDFNGKGGFSVLMGKGWDPKRLEGLQERVLVVGKCAVEEVGERVRSIRKRGEVAFSHGCNNLTETITHLLRWMNISPLKMVPVHPLRSSLLLLQAKAKGSSAAIPPLWIR